MRSNPNPKNSAFRRKVVRRAMTPLLMVLGLPGIAGAQADQQQTPPVAALPPASSPIPQPSAKTPPTPRPEKVPSPEKYGVKRSDITKTTLFEKETPGQPISSDPPVIRTLDEALAVAFRRNPNILQAQERAVRTDLQVQQILALRQPTVSASGTYSRLANAFSSGAGGGGVSPAQIQNPFGGGLQGTPPGAIPVQLTSSNAITGTGLGGATNTTGTGVSASQISGGTGAQQQQQPFAPGGSGVGAVTGRAAANNTGLDVTRQATGGTNNIARAFSAPLDQVSARLTVSQFIDLTGIVRTALQVGDLGKALSRVELARLRQQTALEVRNGYYNLLRSTAFVTVNEAAVAQSEELLRVTRVQLQAGVASQFDVLRAQTQLDNNRQALINSRNQVSLSKNAFANTLGIDPSTPIDPQALEVPPLPNLEEAPLLVQAFDQRPEYVQADINYLLAQKNVRLARRTLEPFLNVNANGAYNATPAGFTVEKATASVGVTLTLPLYDGGATRAQVNSARSDVRSAEITKDQYVRGIKAEVQQTIIAVRDADERRTAISATVAQAREALRLANVRFQAGVGTQLDVNDSQTALTQAETNAVNAQYDYLGALARLSRAVGKPE